MSSSAYLTINVSGIYPAYGRPCSYLPNERLHAFRNVPRDDIPRESDRLFLPLYHLLDILLPPEPSISCDLLTRHNGEHLRQIYMPSRLTVMR